MSDVTPCGIYHTKRRHISEHEILRKIAEGRAIPQAVSRRLPTAAVWGSKLDLGMWDFVMDKSGAGAGFLRELRFPLPIYIPSALHNHLHYHPKLAQ
jgi:hypothetical protein